MTLTPTIDLAAPLYARQAFAHGEHAYRAGDLFPWRERGVEERAVLVLYRAMLVTSVKPAVAPSPAPPVVPALAPPGSGPRTPKRHRAGA